MEYPFARATPLESCPEYAKLRQECPVAEVSGPFGRQAWLLTRYEDVCTALSDPRFIRGPLSTVDDAGLLPNADAPRHGRLRAPAAKFLTPRRMQRLRPELDRLAGELIDRLLGALPESGEFELNAAFGEPLSRAALGVLLVDVLAIPPDEQEFFRRTCASLLDRGAATPALFGELRDYLLRLIAARRAEPGTDLLSVATVQAGESSDGELLALVLNILFGGHAAVVSALGYSVLTLLAAGLWRAPFDAAEVVEEVLRHTPPGDRGLLRQAVTDVQLGEYTVPAGAVVIPCLAAANRDPARFEEPEEFRPERERNAHLAFGHGPHACLGMALARLELEIALDALATRLPTLALGCELAQLVRTHAQYPVSPILTVPLTVAPAHPKER